LSLLLLLPFGQVRSALGATYHGQVVDAETGKPLEGSVVAVVWYKKPILAMGGINYFHNARETITDSEGKFSLDGSEGLNWNPFMSVQEPRIIVFQPGYAPLTPDDPREFKDAYGIAAGLERGAVVTLPKLKTQEEQKNVAMRSFGLTQGPFFQYLPNFMRLRNVQNKMAGYDELREPKVTGGRNP
jgi:hypothetical protein